MGDLENQGFSKTKRISMGINFNDTEVLYTYSNTLTTRLCFGWSTLRSRNLTFNIISLTTSTLVICMIEVLMLIPVLLGAFFYNIKSHTQKADLPVLLGSLNWRATTRLTAHHPPQTSPVILILLRQKCLLVTGLPGETMLSLSTSCTSWWSNQNMTDLRDSRLNQS